MREDRERTRGRMGPTIAKTDREGRERWQGAGWAPKIAKTDREGRERWQGAGWAPKIAKTDPYIERV